MNMSIVVKLHNFVSTKCDDFTVFNKSTIVITPFFQTLKSNNFNNVRIVRFLNLIQKLYEKCITFHQSET